jgi:hypothetical protein
MVRIALAKIRLDTSPTPIGRTPGHLSNAISLDANKGERLIRSTNVDAIRLATEAKD